MEGLQREHCFQPAARRLRLPQGPEAGLHAAWRGLAHALSSNAVWAWDVSSVPIADLDPWLLG